MNFREIQLLYVRELRAALRERNIVINSILLPILLYPFLLWGLFSAMSFVQGQEERFVSRIALDESTAWGDSLSPVAELKKKLDNSESISWLDPPAREQAEAQILAGRLDAIAEILPPTDPVQPSVDGAAEGTAVDAATAGNFVLRVVYSSSKDRSAKAYQRLRSALAEVRIEWLDLRSEKLGIGTAAWQQFEIEQRNVASGREMGSFVLGLLVPLLMIIMIAVGCFYPAIDSTAGERERSTWETLITTGASRSSIIIAKYAYVVTFGVLAGLLNLFAIVLSIRGILGPLLADVDDAIDFGIPWGALPLLALSAVLLAFFLAAGMMIFASFARTFKEGQSMVSPFYLVSILPVMAVQSPDLTLTPKMALIPIVNVTLLCREAIAGTFNWPMIGLTLVVEIVLIALCLELARRILSFEDVLAGSYNGSLGKFIKQRLLRQRRSRRDRTQSNTEGG